MDKPPLILRWEKITGKILAEAIFASVKGDAAALNAKLGDPNSRWPEISRRLGSRFTTQGDRLYCYLSFQGNKDGTKDAYAEICRRQKVEIKASLDRPELDGLPTYCICKFPTDDKKLDFNMIMCAQCTMWYHCPCLKISQKLFDDKEEDYTCPKCIGSRKSEYVPKLWRPSLERSSNCDKIGDVREAGTTSEEAPETENQTAFNPDDNDVDNVSNSDTVKLNRDDAQSDDTGACGSPNEVYGPVEIEAEFIVQISAKNWEELVPQKNPKETTDPRYKYRLPPKVWTHRFNEYFMTSPTINPDLKGCTLKFVGHRVSKGQKSKQFLTADAICKRRDERCTMQFEFSIKREPEPLQDVQMIVRAIGIMQHDPTKISRRHFAGVVRQEGKQHLKTTIGSKMYRELNTKSEDYIEQLKRGNYTKVPSKNVLRVARTEAFEESDKDKDVFLDLKQRRAEMREYPYLQGKVAKGFIQDLSISKFILSMYTESQLDILNRLLSINPGTTLHLDSTGRMSANLPSETSKRTQYYYAAVVQFPGTEPVSCLPVLEFILNSHTISTIAYTLKNFLRCFAEFSNKKTRGYGIRRVETDYSHALIQATLEALKIGPLEMYLRICFKALVKRLPVAFVHHICRSHATKFLLNQVKEKYAGREGSHQRLKDWCKELLVGIDLYDYGARLDEIILITGKKYYTRDVQHCLSTLCDRPNKSVRIPLMELDIEDVPELGFQENEKLPLYVFSPFSYFAIIRCHNEEVPISPAMYRHLGLASPSQDETEDIASSQGELNPYFNIGFLEYLIQNIFPIICLLNHSLIVLNGFSTSSDNNAVAESWNKIIKKDELESKIPMKAGRLADYLEQNIKGRSTDFSLALGRYERSRKGLPDEDDTEEDNNVDPPASSSGSSHESQATVILPGRKGRAADPVENLDLAEEIWGSKKGAPLSQKREQLSGFTLIPYGATLTWNGKQIDASNSCNIDTCLFISYYLYTKYDSFKLFVNELSLFNVENAGKLLTVFEHLRDSKFNEAREVVVFEMMKLNAEDVSNLNLFGSEERFLNTIRYFFSMQQTYVCKKRACPVTREQRLYPLVDVLVRENQAESFCPTFKEKEILRKCVGNCKGENVSVTLKWWKDNAPPFVAFPIVQGIGNFSESDIPQEKYILGKKYKLVAYTMFNRVAEHFYAVIIIGKSKRIYDDLNCKKMLDYAPADSQCSVSTVWYVETKF